MDIECKKTGRQSARSHVLKQFMGKIKTREIYKLKEKGILTQESH
jgi:hypothetical protein